MHDTATPARPALGPWVLGGLGLAWLGLWPAGLAVGLAGDKSAGDTAVYTAANLLPFLPVAVLPVLAYGGRYFVALRVLSVLWWLGLAGTLAGVMLLACLPAAIRPEQLSLLATDVPAFQQQAQFHRADFFGADLKWPDPDERPAARQRGNGPAGDAKPGPAGDDRPAADAPLVVAPTAPGDWEDADGPAEWKRKSPPPRVELFTPDGPGRVRKAALALFVVFLLSAACFLPAVRRLAALVTPVDPDDFLHATALAAVVLVTGACLVPLAAMNEPPMMAVFRAAAGEAKEGPGRAVPARAKPAPAGPDRGAEVKPAPDPSTVSSAGDRLPAPDAGDGFSETRGPGGMAGKVADDLRGSRAALQLGTVLPLIWVVPLGMLSVGYLWQRSAGEALARLGFVVPRPWHVALAVGVTAALVAASPLLDSGISRLWQALGGRPTDAEGVRFLFEFALTPLGAVCVGVFAGVNEEMFFRGVLQPKVGIPLSNLCFTAVHALQYHADGLAVVFVLGLVLALVRKYTNTTTSAIVHGSFDAVLLTFAALGVRGY